MKYATIILVSLFLIACKEHALPSSPSESRMPVTEIIGMLKENLPEEAAQKIKEKGVNERQFDLGLTEEQFEGLKFNFTNALEKHARSAYTYDRFTNRATKFKEGFSAFSFLLGRGDDYHCIITGSFVSSSDGGNVVIWINPTRG